MPLYNAQLAPAFPSTCWPHRLTRERLSGGKGYTLTFTLLIVERVTLSPPPLLLVERNTPSRPHYTPSSSHPAVGGRDKLSRPNCWQYILEIKTTSSLRYWWWKSIYP